MRQLVLVFTREREDTAFASSRRSRSAGIEASGVPYEREMHASPYVSEIVRNSAATATQKKIVPTNCAVRTRTESRLGTDVAKSDGAEVRSARASLHTQQSRMEARS